MDGTQRAGANTARDASLLDACARTAAFTSLRPALDALAAEAGTDPRLSPDSRRVLRAVTRTHPTDTLALAGLAARASTPKTRIPDALHELEARGYLARLTHIAPHLAAALSELIRLTPPPSQVESYNLGGSHPFD
ncbi:hypothetical protein [Kocuria oceani]|uniref:HTH iclR-type domain-containing protein n=1 Tax=Kocuria oceani TaxID=988827 RepID=A0ABV9TK25_9MICC|nr:hypothetical protein [Kocuria oceani]